MYQYHCLNPISQIGLDKFTENYQKTEAAEAADAILVRSASMHEMELPENLKVVARAGAGATVKREICISFRLPSVPALWIVVRRKGS